MSTPNPRPPKNPLNVERPESLVRRSWHVMTDMLSPFSASALATLPNAQRPQRYTRADAIPETENDEDGQRPTIRDYHAINSLPPMVRVPKKIATPVRVEGKVCTALITFISAWVSWLNLSILIGTLALALFNASQDDIARNFAYAYALISAGVLVYAYLLYQHRITMIRRRDPGHFDAIIGPLVISALLFFAIFANFFIRVRELREKNVPIPGAGFISTITQNWYPLSAGDRNSSLFSLQQES
ncbi:uncharacterized protein EV420DRAFT_1660468 [Desarmillaria tabescens]|uniref:DUF202 domain-containing protein n=1 Tax=Armillaria tabescens TaxID=1929756 RepID=A0AA39TXY8_ARMTA|nr:uncharacterized protein EV420DRAFT_1660468 [Desarmillaria tabescens]KAK0469588.1 hypothetical protein EV420DRAFT_1660468 [Desarmillaria tabescens]